jgi:hypothetical protein
MARIFTKPEQEQYAKVLMHDVTVAGGMNANNLRTYSLYWLKDKSFITAAQKICDELVNRNFVDLDNDINVIASYHIHLYDGSNGKKWKPEGIAKAIVYFAELLQIYWDDTIRTPYEIDEFKKTLLGAAVYKYGRYISAISNKRSSRSTSASTGNAGQAPKNGYKQSGSQLANVRDLIDIPGNPGSAGTRLDADTDWIFFIKGKLDNSKNAAIVHIKPLSSNSKYVSNGTNKVCISSGNAYTDCTCYFDDPNDAQAFLDKITNANAIPVNVSGLQVVKNKADKIKIDENGNQTGGYFMVGTEFGPCTIKAATLNESLNELEEAAERPFSWEKATKGYSDEELNELHTWMRRD